jgi:hypothetical protein
MRRHAFVFVCQAGELEVKALLLAASLRRFLHPAAELIAAVPTPSDVWGELSADTRAQLQAFGATIVPIVNPIGVDYPIGNKLSCIDVPATAQRIVFLDSDMLCLRDFGDPELLRVPFAAKPADLRTFAGGADAWRPLYAAVDVALPDLRLPTTVSGEFGLPYFNSGVIFVDNGLAFGRAWIDCARTIGHVGTMPAQRHWLDQVSLPLAVHQLGLSYAALDERFNFPAHLKTLGSTPPFFCHYHWPRIVRREPALLALVRDLARTHGRIARVMTAHRDWAQLLDGDAGATAPATAARSAPAPASTIVVAGIPGSGAAELVQALARQGAAVLAGSPELMAALASRAPPLELAALFEHGMPDRSVTAPGVELALLCRLGALRRALPAARLVVCVRDPIATIGAWKAQPELFDAAVAWVAAHGRHWLDPAPRAQFERVAEISAIAERRAAWWWWLAQRVLDHADDVTIVRSSGDAVERIAGALIAATDAGGSIEHDDASGEVTLDATDRQAIRAICLQAAADLGVAR